MSRKNGNHKLLHTNTLMPSSIDEVGLCQEVNNGFITVCNTYKGKHGVDLEIPASLDKDMLRWRQMAVRYQKKDMRHTEAELESLKVIAQWTVSVNCKLQGQPDKRVTWK